MHFRESDNPVLTANYLLKLSYLFAIIGSANVRYNEFSDFKKMGSYTNLKSLGGSRMSGWVVGVCTNQIPTFSYSSTNKPVLTILNTKSSIKNV